MTKNELDDSGYLLAPSMISLSAVSPTKSMHAASNPPEAVATNLTGWAINMWTRTAATRWATKPPTSAMEVEALGRSPESGAHRRRAGSHGRRSFSTGNYPAAQPELYASPSGQTDQGRHHLCTRWRQPESASIKWWCWIVAAMPALMPAPCSAFIAAAIRSATPDAFGF